jgi:hypothetical protein
MSDVAALIYVLKPIGSLERRQKTMQNEPCLQTHPNEPSEKVHEGWPSLPATLMDKIRESDS